MASTTYRTQPGAKFLDAFTNRTTTSTSNNQRYDSSFNTTTSNSTVTSDSGNTTLTLGGPANPGDALDKVLPWVAVGGLVIAGLVAIRSTK
jgi:hypothetical protein